MSVNINRPKPLNGYVSYRKLIIAKHIRGLIFWVHNPLSWQITLLGNSAYFTAVFAL